MRKNKKQYVIGVDGGGTKTIALAADLYGKVLGVGRSGSSSVRNDGIEKSADAVVLAIEKAVLKIKEKNILSVFIGLPAMGEEYSNKRKEIKKQILKRSKFLSNFKNKIFIGSDQNVAFRSGTDEKNGIVVIAGTGCVARGWNNGKDIKSSSWGWLADEGSASWVGHQAYQKITKSIDNRSKKTILTDLVLKKFKIKNPRDLGNIIYEEHPVKILSQLSLITDLAAEKGDKIAMAILFEAGEELALSVKTIIDKLNFRKEEFPLVLVGGMFKSKIILNTFKKEVKKIAPKVKFIQPKEEPAIGAVKLALEQIKCGNF